MKDKVVIVTGANSGIGKETAKALAQEGAIVIMACRNAERAEQARGEIVSASANDKVSVMALDLASLESVRSFVNAFQEKYDHLDVLINNAGLFPMTKQMTVDGFEMQFGVNHLGHFLLTDLLMPQLQTSDKARIINVASMIHHIGKIDFDSFRGDKPYNPMRAYGQSKLANVLFTRQLAKRLQGSSVTTYSLHPGAVGTNIAGRTWLRRTLYKLIGAFLTPKRGARTSLYLARTPDIEHLSGCYFDERCKVKPGSKLSQSNDIAEKLWNVSEQLLA